MANKTIVSALNSFFNAGDGVSIESTGGGNCPATVAGIPVKRPTQDWVKELKALSPAEKLELARGVCAITGDTLTMAKTA